MDTTRDGLLNRRITLEQPAQGYRVAVDTILLAAAVPATANAKVLDLGCGVGGAMLALACRVPGVMIRGLEIQPELARLCASNIAGNALQADLAVSVGDVTCLPDTLCGLFDHVMMNPPYHDTARHDVSPDPVRQRANAEQGGELAQWLASATAALKPSGCLTLIHRADRLEEILGLLRALLPAVRVLPICSKLGVNPKRVVVQAQFGAAQQASVPPFVLHRDDGSFTPEAQALLRDLGALRLDEVSTS